jgi:hypothetical protein
MGNWIDYNLDILANSPTEINQIAKRLNQPSQELVSWVAGKFGQSANEVAEGLKDLLEFKTVSNLGNISNELNKARRFSLAFKDRSVGIVNSHLSEVSEAFPAAIFLVEYFDQQWSYAGKRVIKAGKLIQQIHDGQQEAQAIDWVLVDIFAPFRSEYELGVEFGSLWQKWLAALTVAVQGLKDEQASLGRS